MGTTSAGVAKASGMPSTRTPGPGAIHAAAVSLLSGEGVVGYYVGRKHVGGRATRRLGLVMLVRKKISAARLDRRRLLPSSITWKHTSTREREFPLDVRVLDEPFRHAAAVIGPGDGVASPAGPRGSVGVALRLRSNGAAVVTTAAHVVQGLGPGAAVQLTTMSASGAPQTVNGTLQNAVLDDRADYAIVVPDGQLPVFNTYGDDCSLGAPALPAPEDIGRGLFVLSPRGLKSTKFRGVFASVPTATGRLVDALLTDYDPRTTQGGDSGSCLADSSFRPWGLLVGWSRVDGSAFSVFMPVNVPIVLENADLL
jgi:hypothetical protein